MSPKFLASVFPVLLVVSCKADPKDSAKTESSRTIAPAKPARAESTADPAYAATDTIGTQYIPPQCYTKTKDDDGKSHNPCFTCHVDALPPNYVRDSSFQTSYDFGPKARVNPWTNLFVDRSEEVAAQTDEETLAYVRQDNYRGTDKRPGLADHLRQNIAKYDVNGDGKWTGWMPDIQFRFDDEGFDRSDNGEETGWRAFAYYPLPGTFWPTNGSFGDAAIRLDESLRKDEEGRLDRAIYKINLAIVESLIARRDVAIPEVDEKSVEVDLDADGTLGKAKKVKFAWKPQGNKMSYVGLARGLQASGKLHLVAGLFPERTEFAHSVRYLDVREGRVAMAARMKELRYMVKRVWHDYGDFEQQALQEANEKEKSPEKTRPMTGSVETGIGNRAGWSIQGFIESADGSLRPQTMAEHGFCIGCHSGIGATDDSVFSFGRKLLDDDYKAGWYHWSERGLEGVGEPRRADGRGEYSLYLEENGAGDELRANEEILARFFSNGRLKGDAKRVLAADVTKLLLPSPERALVLDKAYRVLVREQSYEKGRDASVKPVKNVHRELPSEPLETGVDRAVADRRVARRN